MIVFGYTTLNSRLDSEFTRPIKFDDVNSDRYGAKKLIEGLHVLNRVFCKPSDCVWIVPGTED